jgi:hypothetical protein
MTMQRSIFFLLTWVSGLAYARGEQKNRTTEKTKKKITKKTEPKKKNRINRLKNYKKILVRFGFGF